MDQGERKVLTILSNTNQTLFNAKKSNEHRIQGFQEISDTRYSQLKNISVSSLENPLDVLRDEIYHRLMFSLEYVEFLSKIKEITIYDVAELIVEVGDIKRFKNKDKFIAYAGLSPIIKNNNRYYKIRKYSKGNIVANKKTDPIDYSENLKTVIMRCTQKMIKGNSIYTEYYHKYYSNYQYKHPRYPRNRLHLMALKKTSVKFAKYIYTTFNEVAKIEEEENL